jgi:hypothetical protein
MAYQSRARAAANRKAPPPPPELREARLTIPDALVAWARETDRQIAWARPFGDEVAAILAEPQPLMPNVLAVLLNRLDAIVSAAIGEGRSDLLGGFDLQTAEWLGLHVHIETARGHLHVGPDPRTRSFEGASEPPWTYNELRVVFDAKEPAAVDLAWKAKQMLLEVFPQARIEELVFDKPITICVACEQPAGGVMLTTNAGDEYHAKCWSEMVAPLPEHLRAMLKKAPKAKAR